MQLGKTDLNEERESDREREEGERVEEKRSSPAQLTEHKKVRDEQDWEEEEEMQGGQRETDRQTDRRILKAKKKKKKKKEAFPCSIVRRLPAYDMN